MSKLVFPIKKLFIEGTVSNFITSSNSGIFSKFCLPNYGCSIKPYFSTFSYLYRLDGPSQHTTCISPSKFKSMFHEQTRSQSFWNSDKKLDFGKYSIIYSVDSVSPPREVPSHIIKPEYAQSGLPAPRSYGKKLKDKKEVEAMRDVCHVAREVLEMIADEIKVGVTTDEIDALCHEFAIANNCYPSPLNYKSFPKSVCTSVNNVACHGIPDGRPLEDGDVISVDVTVYRDGFHGDCCETFLVGSVDALGNHLVDAARKCRDVGISVCGPGVALSEIGSTIERVALEENVSVNPNMTGHGIGREFHNFPDIFHFKNNYPGIMSPGMTFTIEPVVAQGKSDILLFEDGWTIVTEDYGRTAQFEHTILITENGHDILTV